MLFREQEVNVVEKRIHSKDRMDGMHYYEMRHGDDDSEPCTIEKAVFVNFFGTVISAQPITSLATNKDYIELTETEIEDIMESMDRS